MYEHGVHGMCYGTLHRAKIFARNINQATMISLWIPLVRQSHVLQIPVQRFELQLEQFAIPWQLQAPWGRIYRF